MSDDAAAVEGTLLVPIANAETAARQFETALDIATDRSYRILLVYVVDVPPQLSLTDGRRYLLEDEDERMLSDAAARVEAHGVPVDKRIRVARGVATGILGVADRHDVDAILLGWRGRPPRPDVVLGNHIDSVLQNAACDVLVQRIKTPRPDPVESVLVPIAGGPHEGLSTDAAASIACRNDAAVTLLHVRDPDDPEQTQADAEALLANAADAFDGIPSLERELVERDDVAGTITDWTADHDVTVLGVSRGGLIQRALLGSISEAVGRHAANTVVLAKRYESVSSRLRRLFSGR
ncbi:universal stress protein [Natronorubrum aibiense]|uniref:Universal stress protein UspA n=1 Tax=Natronorubrum aibiense TaxID=348826 RepID=A0A5P9P4M5_9EURY|nr:universal stress protein [Natronorubrum aibiense]QFU83094.1 universal stress protein UspA [Natronorubrum aibiense]